SFALRNACLVNNVLYALKQIPLVKRLLPDTLYQERGLKIFANLIAGLWELSAAFLGKALCLGVLFLVSGRYGEQRDAVFLYQMLLCTWLGAYVNTYMFDPSKDKYYALILLRMDARVRTLTDYGFAMGELLLGYLLFCPFFGGRAGLALWQCLLLPFFAVGMKLFAAALELRKYEKTRKAPNENKAGAFYWIRMAVMLAAAFGLPELGVYLPAYVSLVLMILALPLGAVSLVKILRFPFYRELYQELLGDSMDQMDKSVSVQTKAMRVMGEKAISQDTGITSSRKGFEYLNELFIKRHQKILWKSAKRIAAVCLILTFAGILLCLWIPTARQEINMFTLRFLPFFVFIMYLINRGTGFTQVLFVNCDSSLMTYSFYKEPGRILALFRIRLRELVKINLLPAAVIGFGLAALLLISGGTDNPWNYAVLIVSILCMSVFFSVHYLTLYYLLQPYTLGAELKSGTYRIALTLTYLVCWWIMRMEMSTQVFGLLMIVFCAAYSVIACVLVYRMAPETFRIRT
ncbi:MAG: hypothetical protein Q4C73_12225, partial [Eubacteriales bacterium]|nr:hypothetical protein [Eubacteriales bacterium]